MDSVVGRFARLSLLVLTLAAGIAGQYWLSLDFHPTWSAAAWALAAIGFVATYWLGRDARQIPSPTPEPMPAIRARLWLALVLLVGAFFMVYRIDEIPPGLNHDAAWEGLYALRILNGEPYTPYAAEAWGRETMTFYFRAASAWLLGPTVLAVQAPGLLAGFLTLPFFYVWLRQMFGARLALIATLLLAVSGWHLIFSRTGWRSDFQPLFMAATCCFFIRGMRGRSAVDFLLAGISLALTLNTYNGSRVFPAVFGIWLIAVALQSWRLGAFLRRYAAGLGVMGLAFGIAIAPLAWFAIHNWSTFMGRAAALRGASRFQDALFSTLLLFNWRGNGDDFFIREPALEFAPAVFFVFGLLWVLMRLRDERAQFLVIALLINLVPGMVSKPNLNRDVGTMIFVYALSGLGIVYFAQQLRASVPRIGHALAVLLIFIAGGAAAAEGYRQYLSDSRRAIWGYYPETTVVGRYIHGLVPDYDIWVGGANFPRDSLTYLSYQGQGDPMRRNYTWVDDVRRLGSAPPRARGGRGRAFVLANHGDSRSVLRTLAQRFPSHESVELRYPPGKGSVFAKAILVPAGEQVAPTSPELTAVPVVATAPAGQLEQPRDIAVLSDGAIVVTDFGHHRVQVFDGEWNFLRQWGVEGSANGEFREPTGLAVDADDRVYVADTWNSRIQRFHADGRFDRESPGAFYGARGVAVAPDGMVFVADSGNNRIVALSSQLAVGASWGGRGAEPGQLLEPIDIAVGPEGNVWVADNGNGRVQVFTRTGELRRHFAVPGWGSAVYSEPRMTFDAGGRLWVTVPRAKVLIAFDLEGREVMRVADARVVELDMPMGLAWSAARGDLAVAGLNGRLAWVSSGAIAR